ncbi:hypothetical protein D3C72_1044750 [compost metagenome]
MLARMADSHKGTIVMIIRAAGYHPDGIVVLQNRRVGNGFCGQPVGLNVDVKMGGGELESNGDGLVRNGLRLVVTDQSNTDLSFHHFLFLCG